MSLRLDEGRTRPVVKPGLSYPEALHCTWRLTWPLAILGTLTYYVAIAGIEHGYLPNPITTEYVFLTFVIINSSLTFFLLPSLVNRKFSGFSLTVNDGTKDYAGMPIRVHARIWAWITTMETFACVFGWFLISPLALLLSLIGVHRNGLVLILAFTLALRPLMVKLATDKYFSGFHLELRRA